MADTIELLETIGQDASLRHAPSGDLVQALKNLGASDALQRAVLTGEDHELKAEMGRKNLSTPQLPPPQSPGPLPSPLPKKKKKTPPSPRKTSPESG